MAIKPTKADKPKISIWRILGGLVAMLALMIYMAFHAFVMTESALYMALPNWQVSYGSCWPNPFGGAWVTDVDLIPVDGSEEESYHFDSLWLDVPIIQYYKSGLFSDDAIDLGVIDNISLEFSGGKGPSTWPFLDELWYVGNDSASPFEAAGCAEDNSWIAEEFPGMGLENNTTTLGIHWQIDGDKLSTLEFVETEGVGRAEHRSELTFVEDAEFDDFKLNRSEWHIVDGGFVAARNRFCAQKDGVPVEQFVQRHVDAVERMLAALGMRAGDSTMAAYRQFAERGGTLDLVMDYSPAIDSTVYEDEDWSAWVDRARGDIAIDGQSRRMSMRTIKAQPFAEGDERTVFEILQAEQAHRVRAEAQAALEEPLAEPESIASSARVSPTVDNPPEVLRTIETEVVERPATILEYRKLAAEVGQRFKLYSKGKSPMRIEVVGMQDGLVKVRRYVRSGWLEHTIQRAGFERAERIR